MIIKVYFINFKKKQKKQKVSKILEFFYENQNFFLEN